MTDEIKKQNQLDGLVNVMSGIGTLKSKREYNVWDYGLINNWQQLDACYQTNWIARQICDVPSQDMTREWRTIKSTDAETIAAVEQELGIASACEECLSWSALYGGAGLLMLTGQDLETPLRLNDIKKGDLERVIVFDRWELSAQQLNTWDVLAPNYLQPEFYTVQGGHQRIHWSHVARFYGEKLPRRQLAQTQGWGDSVLRKCLEDISDMVAAKNGIAELMQEANLDVLKSTGLAEALASDEDDSIIKRYELFSLMKSSINMALLDSEEELDRKTLNLGGAAPVIELFMTWISGSAEIPVTKLFGTSAKGLNATGEGDMKNYYDRIRGDQNSRLNPPIRVIDEVMVRSALGTFPTDFDYVWNPLSQPNVTETETANLLKAQKDQIYLEMGVIMPSQIMRELQTSEQYQFEDDDIEQLEEMEDPNLFGELGSSKGAYIDPEGNSLTEEEIEQRVYENGRNTPSHFPRENEFGTAESDEDE